MLSTLLPRYLAFNCPLDIGKEVLALAEHLVYKINVMGDDRHRCPVNATVLDQVLHFAVLAAFAGFGDDQDIIITDVFVGNAALCVPMLHPTARSMAPE